MLGVFSHCKKPVNKTAAMMFFNQFLHSHPSLSRQPMPQFLKQVVQRPKAKKQLCSSTHVSMQLSISASLQLSADVLSHLGHTTVHGGHEHSPLTFEGGILSQENMINIGSNRISFFILDTV